MSALISEQSKGEYIFSELTNLCLHDIKAQKKTMSMKKFKNIPLNRQQIMDLKFKSHAREEERNPNEFYQTHFRIRMGKRRKEKLLERLSNPKKHQIRMSETLSEFNSSETQNIIKKCSKLKDKILTENKIQKVKKYVQSEYSTLLEQSKWLLAVHCKNS